MSKLAASTRRTANLSAAVQWLLPVPVILCQRLSLSARGLKSTLRDMMTGEPFSMDDAPRRRETAAKDLQFAVDRETEWAELATRSLGRLSLSEVRDLVTKTMLAAALARVNYNYSRAAALLCVTRQSVQYLVVRHDIRPRPARAASGSTLSGARAAPVDSSGSPSSARG